jgi:hypothetical protein
LRQTGGKSSLELQQLLSTRHELLIQIIERRVIRVGLPDPRVAHAQIPDHVPMPLAQLTLALWHTLPLDHAS